MDNETGLKLKRGNQVWLIGMFEDCYSPYRVCLEPYMGGKDNQEVFVRVIRECDYHEDGDYKSGRFDGERMNVRYTSFDHPKGWKFIKPEDNVVLVGREVLELTGYDPFNEKQQYTLKEFVAQAKHELDAYEKEWSGIDTNEYHKSSHTWTEWWGGIHRYWSW